MDVFVTQNQWLEEQRRRAKKARKEQLTRRFAIALLVFDFIAAGFVGGLFYSDHHRPFITSTPAATTQQGVYQVSPAIAIKPANDINTPDLSATPKGQWIIQEARKTCTALLPTNDPACASLPIKVQDLPNPIVGMVNLNSEPEQGLGFASQMRLDPTALDDPSLYMGLNYYLSHEWMHVRIAQITRTGAGQQTLNQRAAIFFSQRTGRQIDADRGGEMLTDCMTWNALGMPVTMGTAYLNEEGHTKDSLCQDWKDLLVD